MVDQVGGASSVNWSSDRDFQNLQSFTAELRARSEQGADATPAGNQAFPPDADGQRPYFENSEYPEAWQRQSHCIGQCHGNNPGYPTRPMTQGEKTVLLAAQLASTAWIPFMGEANATRLGVQAMPLMMRGGGVAAALGGSRLLTTGAVGTATVATGALAIQQTQQMDRADPAHSKPAPVGGGYQAANPSASAIGASEGYQAADPLPMLLSTPAHQAPTLKLATPDNPGITLPNFVTVTAANALSYLQGKGYTGVTQDAQNGLNYAASNALFPSGVRTKPDGTPTSSIVQIRLTGDYDQDFEAASRAGFGQKSEPKFNGDTYVWHHLNDYNPVTGMATMQLVNRDAHRYITHYGSVAQYKAANNGEGYVFTQNWKK